MAGAWAKGVETRSDRRPSKPAKNPGPALTRGCPTHEHCPSTLLARCGDRSTPGLPGRRMKQESKPPSAVIACFNSGTIPAAKSAAVGLTSISRRMPTPCNVVPPLPRPSAGLCTTGRSRGLCTERAPAARRRSGGTWSARSPARSRRTRRSPEARFGRNRGAGHETQTQMYSLKSFSTETKRQRNCAFRHRHTNIAHVKSVNGPEKTRIDCSEVLPCLAGASVTIASAQEH